MGFIERWRMFLTGEPVVEPMVKIEVDRSESEEFASPSWASADKWPEEEQETEQGIEQVRRLIDRFCDIGEDYSLSVEFGGGFTVYDGHRGFFFKDEAVGEAVEVLSAELARLRQRIMPFRAFVGYVLEEVAAALHRRGQDPLVVNVTVAKKALRDYPLNRMYSVLQLDHGTAEDYKARLFDEFAQRWQVFLLDLQNGEI
jgi:hypothetical protein